MKNNFVEAFQADTYMDSFFVPERRQEQIMKKQGPEKAGQILFIKSDSVKGTSRIALLNRLIIASELITSEDEALKLLHNESKELTNIIAKSIVTAK